MSKVIPGSGKQKHVLCEQCGTLYLSDYKYKEIGLTPYKVCRPCPECGYKYNTVNLNSVPKIIYFIIAVWRIFWHGRIDYEEEEEKNEI